MNYSPLQNYFSFLKEESSILIRSAIYFFIAGFLYTLFSSPKYEIDIVISKAEQDSLSQAQSGSSLISLALKNDAGGSKFYYDFKENFYSMDVTNLYDRDFSGMSKLYNNSYDLQTLSYKPIKNLDTTLKSIKYFILGVDYSRRPSLSTLNEFIRASISVNYDKYADNIIISSESSNPSYTKVLIEDLLRSTDNNFKLQEEKSLAARIKYLNSQLNEVQSLSQREAISQILKGQLLKYALVKSDSFYKINIVRNIEVSAYPTSPNLAFNILIFTFAGFFFAILFITLRFAKENTKLFDFSSN